jgi:hypothetical protein
MDRCSPFDVVPLRLPHLILALYCTYLTFLFRSAQVDGERESLWIVGAGVAVKCKLQLQVVYTFLFRSAQVDGERESLWIVGAGVAVKCKLQLRVVYICVCASWRPVYTYLNQLRPVQTT